MSHKMPAGLDEWDHYSLCTGDDKCRICNDAQKIAALKAEIERLKSNARPCRACKGTGLQAVECKTCMGTGDELQ